MNRTCVVVADTRRARFFGVEPDGPRSKVKLIERAELAKPDLRELGSSVTGRVRTETNTNREAGPVHPMGAQRERHRVELEQRFGQEIAGQAGEITRGWKEGTIVLVAEPRLLGLIRDPMRKALHPGIELKELAKDYAQLTTAELHDHLALNSIIPARRSLTQ